MSLTSANSDDPLHLQVAERIKGLIARKHAPGDVLPPYVALAREFGVGLVTVKRAMDVLAAAGIVTPIRRRGTVVNRHIRPGETRLRRAGLVTGSTLAGLFDSRRLSEICGGLCAGIDALHADLRIFPARRPGGVAAPEVVIGAGADGVILLDVRDAGHVAAFAGRDVPLVVLDHRLGDLALDYVVRDNAAAAAAVVEHLVSLGHDRIAYVEVAAPAADDSNRVERREAFAAAMGASLPGAPAPVLTYTHRRGGPLPEGLLDEMTTALRSGPEAPSAAVTDEQTTAARLIAHMTERGIRVPADISVAAVAAAGMAEPDVPPLTCCRFDFHAMGARGAELLALRTHTPRPDRPNVERVRPQLHVGKTAAPHRKKGS